MGQPGPVSHGLAASDQQVRVTKTAILYNRSMRLFLPLRDYSGRYLRWYCIIPATSHSFFSPQMIWMNMDDNSTLRPNLVSSCFDVITYHFTDDYLQYPTFFILIGVHFLPFPMHQDSGQSGVWAYPPHRFCLSQLSTVSLVSSLCISERCRQSALPFHHIRIFWPCHGGACIASHVSRFC
jgi:hypothetical protein